LESTAETSELQRTERAAGEAFVEALVARDSERLRAALHPDAHLRALVPSGFKESIGSDAVAARMESWFAAPESLTLVSKTVSYVSDRLRVQYRFDEHYADGDSEVIEQDAYCEVREGRIGSIDLLCSGHLPGPAEPGTEVRRFDAGELGCGSGLPQEFRRQISALPVGGILETAARDPAAKEDLPALARMLGHDVLSVTTTPDGQTIVTVKRGDGSASR
jgi:TusA-related sulfurtransferase